MSNEEKIKFRIACPEAGYPLSEALWANEEEFLEWFLTVEPHL